MAGGWGSIWLVGLLIVVRCIVCLSFFFFVVVVVVDDVVAVVVVDDDVVVDVAAVGKSPNVRKKQRIFACLTQGVVPKNEERWVLYHDGWVLYYAWNPRP